VATASASAWACGAGFRLLFLRDLPPERGDLDHLRAEADVRQAEAASDDEQFRNSFLI